MKIDKTGRVLSDSAFENMGGSGRFKAKHGMRNTPEYRTWSDMKNRCLNPRVRSYSNYGGRGITVCKEWVESFEEFFKYVGPRPDGYSLDRIDTDGNYEPGNVRWVTNRSQQNNKRNTVFVMFDGQKISASEYARAVGMKPDTVHARIRRGLKLDGAIICK
ncbi:TPA: AsnC family protein [Escherichia coli]|nr:AsnC family protein [Escherichia coli]